MNLLDMTEKNHSDCVLAKFNAVPLFCMWHPTTSTSPKLHRPMYLSSTQSSRNPSCVKMEMIAARHIHHTSRLYRKQAFSQPLQPDLWVTHQDRGHSLDVLTDINVPTGPCPLTMHCLANSCCQAGAKLHAIPAGQRSPIRHKLICGCSPPRAPARTQGG